MLDTKDIRKPALRDAASQRHLPALELGLAATWSVVSAAGLDSLVSLARRLAGARARTTSESLPISVRSRSRSQIVQADFFRGAIRRSETFPTCWFVSHCYSSTGVTSTKWRTCLICPRNAGESCLITSAW